MNERGRLCKPFACVRRYIAVIAVRFIDAEHCSCFTNNDATMQQFVAISGEFINSDFFVHIVILAELFTSVKPFVARV